MLERTGHPLLTALLCNKRAFASSNMLFFQALLCLGSFQATSNILSHFHTAEIPRSQRRFWHEGHWRGTSLTAAPQNRHKEHS
ncbi:hypothetical protein BD410DRAFT_784742 [Rickenella mellea]|uniref:Uncharacterized protein n=1 Tax=Rickenella mellea TaxID=50990 RepID=A0A4Y7QET1_9AGAM|nr:hypothetical protein BD410DRAFT_784742 [Rickenella mellea]